MTTNSQTKRVFLLMNDELYKKLMVKSALSGKKHTDMIRDFVIAGLNPPVMMSAEVTTNLAIPGAITYVSTSTGQALPVKKTPQQIAEEAAKLKF